VSLTSGVRGRAVDANVRAKLSDVLERPATSALGAALVRFVGDFSTAPA